MNEPIRVRHVRSTLSWIADAVEKLSASAAAGTELKCPPILDTPPPVFGKCSTSAWLDGELLRDAFIRLALTLRDCSAALGGIDQELVLQALTDEAT